MRLTRAHILGVALLLGSAWTYAGVPAGAQRAVPVLVIMGASMTGTDIDLGKLRSAYQSHATDFHDLRLIPFNLPVGNTARQIVDWTVLGLAPERVGSFWVDQRVRYGLSPPRSIATREMMLRVIASMRGAIGYVQMNPSAVPGAVRVLKVDGKSPTDSGYVLR